MCEVARTQHAGRPDERLVAGVLVGGQSRRMGTTKALLTHPEAETFVEHVAAVAGRVADEVVLLGQAENMPASLGKLRVLPDRRPGRGPLGGLCALLGHVGEGWGLLLSCDLPLLSRMLLHRLLTARSCAENCVAFVERDWDERLHACCALYHTRVLPIAGRALESNQPLQAVLRSGPTRTLTPTLAETRCLTNVNTREELSALRTVISS